MMFLWWSYLLPLGILALLVMIALFLRRRIFPVRFSNKPLEKGNINVPQLSSVKWKRSSKVTDDLVREWSEREVPDWKEEGKVIAPRVILAKLHAGCENEEMNDLLLSLESWGGTGSTWCLHPNGDYDFTLVPLTSMLFLFGNNEKVLRSRTLDHLLDKLLIARGSKPRKHAPRSLHYAPETENHILMTEGSRYLRSRWLVMNGEGGAGHRTDLEKMEAWLREYLKELKRCGFYEFNSDPYSSYTVTALLNLEAFGSGEVSASARELLDGIFFRYALGSIRYRRAAPFQRQIKRAGKTSLKDPLDSFMVAYCSLHPDQRGDLKLVSGSDHALMAYLLPYRPPDRIMELVMKRKSHYYVRVGHGKKMSPEIFSGGPGFLLSAGGVNRGWFSRIVSRPITLILDDSASDQKEIVHMYGPGFNFRKWNNTGVYDKFAVCAGRVLVPRSWEPVLKTRIWVLYRRNDITIGVYSRPNMGIITLMNLSPEEAQFALEHLNHDEKVLKYKFEYPGGESIRYDVMAPRDLWVITSVGGQDTNRYFDGWPDIYGHIKKKK